MPAFIDENQQFIDPITSAPIVNGTVFFGTQGDDPVTNPITVFADRGLTVPLGVSIATDASGRTTQKIWIPGRYSFEVFDSNNDLKLSDLDAGSIEAVGTTVLTSIAGANDITASADPVLTALVNGEQFTLTAVAINTDKMTVKIDGTDAKPLKFNFNEEMAPGFIQANQTLNFTYNSTEDAFFWGNEGRGISILTNVAGDGSTITADGGPSTTGYVDKQLYTYLQNTTNPTSPVTLKVGTFSTITLKNNGNDIPAGQLVANTIIIVAFNSTGPVFNLVSAFNPSAPGPYGAVTPNTGKFTSVEASSLIGSIIEQGNIVDGAVGQGELKTTTNDISTTLTHAVIVPGGGEFGFWPGVNQTTPASRVLLLAPLYAHNANGVLTNTTLITGFQFLITIGSDAAASVGARQRFVQASPPYDIGDGNVYSFIFASINKAGKIEMMYHAPDPPWANNGPTCIRPEYKKGKKYYRKTCQIDKTKSFEDPNRRKLIEQEITNDFKNSDMGLIPHPFLNNDLTDKSIILIDPNSEIVRIAEEMKESGEFAIDELFFNDYVRFGNEHLSGRSTPNNSIMVVKPTWKNSQ